MSVLPIYTFGTNVLRTKALPVKKVNDEIIKLIIDMFDTMRNAGGIGLAANQVGVLRRVIVLDLSGVEGMEKFEPLALINPVIIEQEGGWRAEEGCLSIQDVRDEVERSESITIQYKDANFRDNEMNANGLVARVILHEIDHLNGVLFIDHLPNTRKRLHKGALKLIQRAEFEVTYPVVTSSITV
ncbi:MAG TPA: peptide deformylase [Bacteroidota bacterium]|nr:peptide deformylase [Bacteroidota bacterium]